VYLVQLRIAKRGRERLAKRKREQLEQKKLYKKIEKVLKLISDQDNVKKSVDLL
jgi:hypothetical protein